MSIWGKILGAGIGFAIGGPLGALIGAAGGHFMDWMQKEGASSSSKDSKKYKEQDKHVAFTIAVVVLAAKMAKADGHVTDDEITKFEEICKIPEMHRNHAQRLFKQAQKDSQGYAVYAKQMQSLFQDQYDVLCELLWILAQIAHADGIIHHSEQKILEDIANIFHINNTDFENITQLTVKDSDNNPYKILKIDEQANDEEIKKAHRQLVRENHPDILMAKGIPQEFIDLATEKVAGINEAYDRIKKMRGIS